MSKKSGLAAFLSSNKGRRFFNIFYSWGASIVIIGALCKILHVRGADAILMFGMITEALVFFVSGFDDSQAGIVSEAEEQTGVIYGGSSSTVAVSSGSTGFTDNKNLLIDKEKSSSVSGGKGTTVIVTGGVSGGTTGAGMATNPTTGMASQQGGTSFDFSSSGISAEDAGKASATAQNMDNFTHVMDSLTTMSSSIQQMSDNFKGMSTGSLDFSENIKNLNQNISNLNGVYEAQMESVKSQMETVKFMNDSLERIKGLYDGAVTDSSVFKYETERMTRQIQALNMVYARLLQAMTSGAGTTGNTNMPPII